MGIFDFFNQSNMSNADAANADPTGAYLGGLIDPATMRQFMAARQMQGLLGLGAGMGQASVASRLPVLTTSVVGSGMQGMLNAQSGLSKDVLEAAQTQNQVSEGYKSRIEAEQLKKKMSFLQQIVDTAKKKLDDATAGESSDPSKKPLTSGSISEPGSVKPGKGVASMTADTSMEPEQRAFLDTISGPESAGKYNVRYTPSGGTPFDSLDSHPRIYEPGPEGPSSAAGRYQFVYSTWQPIADKLGLKDFSEVSQDKAAWYNAATTYNKSTGRDLLGDLKNGKTDLVGSALKGQWGTLAGAMPSFGSNLSKYASAAPSGAESTGGSTPPSTPSPGAGGTVPPPSTLLGAGAAGRPPYSGPDYTGVNVMGPIPKPGSGLPVMSPQFVFGTPTPPANAGSIVPPAVKDYGVPGPGQPYSPIPPGYRPPSPLAGAGPAAAPMPRPMPPSPAAPMPAAPPAMSPSMPAPAAPGGFVMPPAVPGSNGPTPRQIAQAEYDMALADAVGRPRNPADIKIVEYATAAAQAAAEARNKAAYELWVKQNTPMTVSPGQSVMTPNAPGPSYVAPHAPVQIPGATADGTPTTRFVTPPSPAPTPMAPPPVAAPVGPIAPPVGPPAAVTSPAPGAAATPPPSDVMVTGISPSDKQFRETMGTEGAKRFLTRRDAALDALASIENSKDAVRLLNSGMITGAGADARLTMGKMLYQIGFNSSDDAIKNTEAFVALRAGETARIIKAFGSGSGVSDSDKAYAENAAAGRIALNEKSIREILEMGDRVHRQIITRFNKEADSVDPKVSQYPLKVELPPAIFPARPVLATTPDEAAKLPKGTKFVTPDGRTGTAPGPRE